MALKDDRVERDTHPRQRTFKKFRKFQWRKLTATSRKVLNTGPLALLDVATHQSTVVTSLPLEFRQFYELRAPPPGDDWNHLAFMGRDSLAARSSGNGWEVGLMSFAGEHFERAENSSSFFPYAVLGSPIGRQMPPLH